MKKINILLFVLPSISFATVSNGPYVGLEAGVSNQILSNGGFYNNATSATTRVNLGYNFDKINGLEIAGNYGFAGNFSNDRYSMPAQYTSFDASYILNVPTIFQGFSIFGRIGAAYDWINSSSSCNCGANSSISGSNIRVF